MTMVLRVSEAVAKVVTQRLGMFLDEDSYDAIARAAIAAMQPATIGMVSAAMQGRDDTLPPAVIRHIWQVMCDAALAEADLPTDATGVE